MAEATARLGVADVLLVSAAGSDALATALEATLVDVGLHNVVLLPVEGATTAVCNNVLDVEGALVGGVADMGIIDKLDEAKVRLRCVGRTRLEVRGRR
jgi:sugar/nucleoside kinase (ribokinase family)